MHSKADIRAVRDRWMAAWPTALFAWSRFTRLRPPTLCLSSQEARTEGLTGSFAMIRLADQAVIVSLPAVAACGVEGFAVEVLAHEIGHHVLAPATLTDHARSLARMRRALPTVEHHAPMVANLYTDLFINDRLQRSAGLKLSGVYQAIARSMPTPEKKEGQGALWTLYMRIYEILWRLDRGSLGGGAVDDRIEGDAWLGARLVRSYAHQWLDGSGRFAALLLTYLLEDTASESRVQPLLDTTGAAAGGDPAGLTDIDPEEERGAIHPTADPDLADDIDGAGDDDTAGSAPIDTGSNAAPRGQAREPFEYGEILKAAGVKLTDHQAAVRYYRERALPHLVRYPTRRMPESEEPLLEGLEPWDLGGSLDDIDWLQSVLTSPRMVPGVTTVRRLWGTTEGSNPRRQPLDLDIYVDSSGSMANPQQRVSYPALAGAIVCLSALRAGARVQATLWSGTHQVRTTEGFVRDEQKVLTVLTGYLGGGTAFPIHVLRDTYAGRRTSGSRRPTHILVVSDDGVTTMFAKDERGRSGWEIAAESLALAAGGGTFVLNLGAGQREPSDLARARSEGWHIHRVSTWENLVEFARDFSRRAYSLV